MQLTEHFNLAEFAQPELYGCAMAEYPSEWVEERALALAYILEEVRAELGDKPVEISSGYRTPEFNGALLKAGYPVARNSQHCLGLAVDIVVPQRVPMEVYSAALGLHRLGVVRIGGLGLYSGWVHVDIRPQPLVRWAK